MSPYEYPHMSTGTWSTSRHELRFRSLYDPNRALAFPCDSAGCVDVRALSARACTNYLLARASIGREYAIPVVQPPAMAPHIAFAEYT
jgi:hypothetical protein